MLRAGWRDIFKAGKLDSGRRGQCLSLGRRLGRRRKAAHITVEVVEGVKGVELFGDADFPRCG